MNKKDLVEKKAEILEYAYIKQAKITTLFNRGAAYLIAAFGSFVCALLLEAYNIAFGWLVAVPAVPATILAWVQINKCNMLAKSSKYNVKLKIDNEKVIFEGL